MHLFVSEFTEIGSSFPLQNNEFRGSA